MANPTCRKCTRPYVNFGFVHQNAGFCCSVCQRYGTWNGGPGPEHSWMHAGRCNALQQLIPEAVTDVPDWN